MANIIPSIGVSGVFTLTAPFNNILTPNVSYTCIAVRKLSDILASGGTPFETYYEPNGLSKDIYQSDVSSGVCLLSLQPASGVVKYVPTSYISGYPSSGGVPYTVMLLGVSLGAIPNVMDLSFIKSKIADVILQNMGINADIRQAAASEVTMVTNDNHDINEAARLARITDNTTDNAKWLAAEAQLTAANTQIAQLQAWILAHPSP